MARFGDIGSLLAVSNALRRKQQKTNPFADAVKSVMTAIANQFAGTAAPSSGSSSQAPAAPAPVVPAAPKEDPALKSQNPFSPNYVALRDFQKRFGG